MRLFGNYLDIIELKDGTYAVRRRTYVFGIPIYDAFLGRTDGFLWPKAYIYWAKVPTVGEAMEIRNIYDPTYKVVHKDS